MPALVTTLTSLRSWLRRTGLLRFAPRNLGNRRETLQREYEANHASHTSVSVDALSCEIYTGDVTEYCKVKMGQDDGPFMRFLIAGLHPGDACWDIGASIGVYSAILGKAVGPAGRIVSFEPEPRSFARLQRNAELNGLENVDAFNLALGSQRTAMFLHVTDDAVSGQHSLFSGDGGAFQSSVKVEVYPGDVWRKENGRPVPNAIKVDVEGFEEDVLAGLAETLRDENCRTVMCEVHFAILEARGLKDAPARLEKMLQAAGFKTSWIDWSHLGGRKA
jgi:FkbM family methyltransferase